MSGQQFNIAMMLRLEGKDAAKAGVAELTTGVKAFKAEAAHAAAAGQAQSDTLHVLSTAGLRASSSFIDLRAASASCANVWRTTETGADSLRNAVAGLHNSVGQLSSELVGAGAAAVDYRMSLDEIRASFNPLFAASKQYEQELSRIADAERRGAISALEAADARRRAGSIIAPAMAPVPLTQTANINGMHTANIGAQGFDIGVTAAMGMNPAMIGFQQGSQIAQVMNQLGGGRQALQGLAAGFTSILNPMSLVTIGMVTLGAVGIQALMSLGGEAKSLDDALEDLSGSTDAYAKSNERARMTAAALQAEFGSTSQIARQLLQDMAALDRRTAGRDANAVLKALPRQASLALQDPEGEADDLRKTFGLSTWRQESWDMAREVRNAYLEVDRASTLDEQIAAVQRLKEAYLAAAEAAGGITKTEDEALGQIQSALDLLTSLQAQDENAAGNARADEMVRQLQQRIALEGVAIRYGQESAEYRAEENRQARETLLLELEGLGIDRNSEKAREVLLQHARAGLQVEQQAVQVRHDAMRDYLTSQDTQVAAISRELALLGATNEERVRENALADAATEALERNASIEETRLIRAKALEKAEAQIALERGKSARASQLQAQTDALDARISLARDPGSKADLEYEKAFISALAEGRAVADANAAAVRARNKVMLEALISARTSAADMLDELAIRQQVSAQVAAGTIAAGQANSVIQQELQLRPLVAAAARAEGVEKQRLTEVITGLRIAYEAQAAEERRQSQNDYLRSTAERLQQAQLELALLGQSAEVRARILAMVQAEREIREKGLTGAAADYARDNARELSDLTAEIARQADAWSSVQSAGENAIDGILDKLRGGDIKGAFEGLASEIEGVFFDLAVRNPLKNILMGTNLGTLGDVGGLGGIIGRLTGRNPIDEQAVIGAVSEQVQAMQIAATTVTISAGAIDLAGAQGLLGGLPGAANANGAPISGNVIDILTGVGTGGGARADAITHMDQALAGPLSQMVSEAQRLFGDAAVQITSGYRSTERQAQLWQEALAKYGSPEAARKWVAPPGKSNHGHGLAADLRYGSPEVQDWFHQNAGAYGLNYRLQNEPWHIEAAGGGQGRMADQAVAAGRAMTSFTQATRTATTDLGTLGSGMDGLGSALANAIGGSVGGDKGGLLGVLLQLGGSALGIPGFSRGGETGGSDPAKVAGVVHEAEYVFDAASTARIGVRNLDALRRGALPGFRAGGFVSAVAYPAAPQPSNAGAAPQISIHNYTGQPVREESRVDASGQRQTTLVIGEQIAAAVRQPGNAAGKALANGYALRRRGVPR